MKTLPVCVVVQKAHSSAGLGESERLRRGQGDCKTERVWGGDEWRPEAPFVIWALLVPQRPYGRLPPCTLASAHSSPPHPSFFSVTGPSTLMSHGQSDAESSSPQQRGLNSVFLPCCFLTSFLSPLQQHLTTCTAVHVSLFFSEASQKQCENLAIDSCPRYYAATPSLSSLAPCGLFSGKILAVSFDYRFAGLLLTWVGPCTLRRPYFIPMKERN